MFISPFITRHLVFKMGERETLSDKMKGHWIWKNVNAYVSSLTCRQDFIRSGLKRTWKGFFFFLSWTEVSLELCATQLQCKETDGEKVTYSFCTRAIFETRIEYGTRQKLLQQHLGSPVMQKKTHGNSIPRWFVDKFVASCHRPNLMSPGTTLYSLWICWC